MAVIATMAPVFVSATCRATAGRTFLTQSPCRSTSGAVRFVAMTAVVLALLAQPAGAQPVGYSPGPLSSGGIGLLQIDLATGEVTEIGPFGPGVGTVALAFSPDRTLYGIGLNLDGDGQLVNIDRVTGAATLVANLTLIDPSNSFDSLAVDACGRLYAGGLMGVFGGGLEQKIVAVDLSIGTVSEIASGPIGLAARGETLFTVAGGVLSMLDPATREITPVGGTAVPALDLDFGDDGFLWAAHGANPPPVPIPAPPPPGTTFRIHPTTGQVAEVAEVLHEMFGSIAIGPPPGVCGAAGPPQIPVVSARGLGLLAILLAVAGAGILSAQRRRRPVES